MNSSKTSFPFDLFLSEDLLSFFNPDSWELLQEASFCMVFLKENKKATVNVVVLPNLDNGISDIKDYLEQKKMGTSEIIINGQIKVKFNLSKNTALCCSEHESIFPQAPSSLAEHVLPSIWPDFKYDYDFLSPYDKSVFLSYDFQNHRCILKGVSDKKVKFCML